MKFFEEAYPYSIIGGDEEKYRYVFTSTGDAEIIKIVTISVVNGLQNIYNLGFGNLEQDENGTEIVNDSSEMNNKDYDKVLKTVFTCVAHYLVKVNKNAKIIFFGNTVHKHRTYRGLIGNNIKELSEFMKVMGGRLSGEVTIKEEKQIIERKGIRRERTIRVKELDTIQTLVKEAELADVNEVVEDFSLENIANYQFVLIKLK